MNYKEFRMYWVAIVCEISNMLDNNYTIESELEFVPSNYEKILHEGIKKSFEEAYKSGYTKEEVIDYVKKSLGDKKHEK